MCGGLTQQLSMEEMPHALFLQYSARLQTQHWRYDLPVSLLHCSHSHATLVLVPALICSYFSYLLRWNQPALALHLATKMRSPDMCTVLLQALQNAPTTVATAQLTAVAEAARALLSDASQARGRRSSDTTDSQSTSHS